jgi:hypothetical protein
MRPRDAFEICHEIYTGARALVDGRVPTTQLTSASKFLWRPDLHPRLVEYIADFALTGERALGGGENGRMPGEETGGNSATRNSSVLRSRRATQPVQLKNGRRNAVYGREPLRASRLILFRMYYLGGAEYQAARATLGISERTWADWADEIREAVGSELLRARMCPPALYFREILSTSDKDDRMRSIARAS